MLQHARLQVAQLPRAPLQDARLQ
ncbi:hypothetical protein, partial [Thermomonas sp.]